MSVREGNRNRVNPSITNVNFLSISSLILVEYLWVKHLLVWKTIEEQSYNVQNYS